MISPARLHTSNVFNLPVHLLADYGAWLETQLVQNQGGQVITLNPEMVMLAQKDAQIHQIISQADLVVPDGSGIIFYLRLKGFKHQRCPGIELAESLIRQVALSETPYSLAFYGGAPGVTATAAEQWQQKYPNLSILVNHGFLSTPELEQWCRVLQEQQPKVIFVGLGVPRQEIWIRDHRHLCPQSLWIGVGGSFDVWSGQKQRAPKWFCDNNLEWFYRLYQEPWRWRRMLVLPQFMLKTLVDHYL